jgi:hypothetical protein
MSRNSEIQVFGYCTDLGIQCASFDNLTDSPLGNKKGPQYLVKKFMEWGRSLALAQGCHHSVPCASGKATEYP